MAAGYAGERFVVAASQGALHGRHARDCHRLATGPVQHAADLASSRLGLARDGDGSVPPRVPGGVRSHCPGDDRSGDEGCQEGKRNRAEAAAERRTADRPGRKGGGCLHVPWNGRTESRNVRRSAETWGMNLEESIAVAVGVAVAISFLAFFLFGGFGIGLA
jgi:hypothetical protein